MYALQRERGVGILQGDVLLLREIRGQRVVALVEPVMKMKKAFARHDLPSIVGI